MASAWVLHKGFGEVSRPVHKHGLRRDGWHPYSAHFWLSIM